MIFDLVIPSHNREKKLVNCLNSIANVVRGNNKLFVYVYLNTQEEIDLLKKCSSSLYIDWRIVSNYKVPSFWNKHLKQSRSDIMVCLNDDVLLKENTILEIEKAFLENFTNKDGIVGLNQCNGPRAQCLDSAFCAIGLEYANRFPDRQVYCPDYTYLWGDRELGDFAKSVQKFYFAKNAEIVHLHPAFTGESPDYTHQHTRTNIKQDKQTYLTRKNLGYLWGKNFNLINYDANIQSYLSNSK